MVNMFEERFDFESELGSGATSTVHVGQTQ
jgi:hypothetical protein